MLPVSCPRVSRRYDCNPVFPRWQWCSAARLDQVERDLVSTQFIELVKHGLAGMVETADERLRTLVQRHVSAAHSIVVATEHSGETADTSREFAPGG
jgi:hypothetical protein